MPKSRKTSSTTIVLSRYFDKNVSLVAGMCSKCYLEGEDDVKIIAVNRKFLKEVEKRKKLKRTTFLHDDYPCEGDSISRRTFENDSLKLPPATTNDDYALITADTSRSRQMKPRINCYNNNSACGNEVTNLCTNTENSFKPEEKVDNKNYYYSDNIKIQTNENFPTENISNIQCNSKGVNILHNFYDPNPSRSNPIILDNSKTQENFSSFNGHNGLLDIDSIPQQSCSKMEYYSSYEKLNVSNCSSAKDIATNESYLKINNSSIKNDSSEKTPQNIQNISSIEFKNVQRCAIDFHFTNNWNVPSCLSTENDLDNRNSLDIQYPTYSQNNLDFRDCSNDHNDSQFEDNINIENNSNGCGNSNIQNNIIAPNYQDNNNNCNSRNNSEISKTLNDQANTYHHDISHSRNILVEEISILNHLDALDNADTKDNTEIKNTATTLDIQNNSKIRSKINFSKLRKSCNSQKPKWLLLSENSNIKIENTLEQPVITMKNESCNSNTIDSPKTEIKSELVKTDFEEMRRTINFAKLKIKKNQKIEKPIWIPPRSPHNLIEESLFHDPWSLLIATIFLNKTSCMCARPRVEEFLKDFSGPLDVLKERPTKLEKYFLDLGLHKKRAEQVWRMSYDYAYKSWRNPKELYGIGKYGEDAYRMFILGDLDIEPTDRFLRIYRDWARMKQKEDMNTMCPDDE